MSTATATDRLLTVREAAAELRLTPDSVYRFIQQGRLRAVRVGDNGPLRIEPTAIADLLQPTSSARAGVNSQAPEASTARALAADNREAA